MANTTWNSGDKTANCTLTGGNLIATSAAAGGNSVRAVDKQVTGKFYWECTCNTITGTSTGVALYWGAYSLAAVNYAAAGSIGTCGLNRLGTLYVDGTSTVTGFGTIANGTVVCVAFDADTRLIWFRLGAAGNWNNTASANPATGTGGAVTSLGQGIPAYPTAVFSALNDQITANFGDTAFTGAVPSGFTSGFTAGASIAHQRARHAGGAGAVDHHEPARPGHASRHRGMGQRGDGGGTDPAASVRGDGNYMRQIRIDGPGDGAWITANGLRRLVYSRIEADHSFITYRDNHILGGFVTCQYLGNSMRAHMAAENPRWFSRELAWLVCDYVFNQNGCQKMVTGVRSDNLQVLTLCQRGWHVETSIADLYEPGIGMVVLAMTSRIADGSTISRDNLGLLSLRYPGVNLMGLGANAPNAPSYGPMLQASLQTYNSDRDAMSMFYNDLAPNQLRYGNELTAASGQVGQDMLSSMQEAKLGVVSSSTRSGPTLRIIYRRSSHCRLWPGRTPPRLSWLRANNGHGRRISTGATTPSSLRPRTRLPSTRVGIIRRSAPLRRRARRRPMSRQLSPSRTLPVNRRCGLMG